MKDKDLLITAMQAAELAGVSVPTFSKMVSSGGAPEPVPTTRAKVWSLHALLNWLDERDQAGRDRRKKLADLWKSQVDHVGA